MILKAFISLSAGMKLADSGIKTLEAAGLCKFDDSGDVQMTSEGVELKVRQRARLMKKVKITGDASVMIDEMMKELN